MAVGAGDLGLEVGVLALEGGDLGFLGLLVLWLLDVSLYLQASVLHRLMVMVLSIPRPCSQYQPHVAPRGPPRPSSIGARSLKSPWQASYSLSLVPRSWPVVSGGFPAPCHPPLG